MPSMKALAYLEAITNFLLSITDYTLFKVYMDIIFYQYEIKS